MTNTWRRLIADKRAIREALAKVNAETGFFRDPNATPRKAQESMIAYGIREEDNIFSCGIIAARYEDV